MIPGPLAGLVRPARLGYGGGVSPGYPIPPSRRVIAGPDGRLRVEFPYDPRLVALVKGLPGRAWNNGEKFWSVPVEHVVATVDLLRPHGFAFDEETLRLYDAHRGATADHLTVSQLNLRVREVVLSAFPSPLWVVGEVSGFNRSAHKKWVGFQLVERSATGETVAQVEAVLSPDDRAHLEAKLQREGAPFRLEDEIQVRLLVAVDLRPDWGRYQVTVRDIDVAYTLGEVARRREEILRRLTAAGILERNRTLPFPDLPLRVGLVTSLGSDAYHDVLRTFRESGYGFTVTVHGARVQGPNTEASVLNALDWFRERAAEFDLVLVCRGGGSRTDLAWFDSEALGRAVALFPLPVVVGIGHEEDRCVLDEVGWRQKTPTAAAQFVVETVRKALLRAEDAASALLNRARARIGEAGEAHRERAQRLARAIGVRVEGEARDLVHRARRLGRGVRVRLHKAREDTARFRSDLQRSATSLLGGANARLADVAGRLSRGAQRDLVLARRHLTQSAPLVGARSRRRVARAWEQLESRGKRLHSLDPQRVVERGYAIVRLAEGAVVTDASQAPPPARLRVQLKRGVLRARSEGEER
ncbi:MAG: Exodeoxyribonuclease VII large subunit [Candidatus Bipolaricaulis sibiricus]|uniref:Exodeoxyribonuclease VII large subunit n=1 Tax=Bipolaricaulis sibiricus TaxID=2501609 RepID=A0A410FRW9_BIPS1|nr:MAG: Exodeoxyribonuclease VII large subunit [Candidatus Bipolaricaulis sibiricus]